MLNREEYNVVFGHDLSEQEFGKIKPIDMSIREAMGVEYLAFVDAKTHKVIKFYPVVTCGECLHRYDADCPLHFERMMPDDWWCADGERRVETANEEV